MDYLMIRPRQVANFTDIIELAEFGIKGSKCEIWTEWFESDFYFVFALSASGRRVSARYTVPEMLALDEGFEFVVITALKDAYFDEG